MTNAQISAFQFGYITWILLLEISIKMSKAVFKKKLWERQLSDITALLKKSLQSSDKYARKIFQNEQQYYQSESETFISALKKTELVQATFASANIYNQLAAKLKALNQLYFNGATMGEISTMRIKNSRIERFMKMLQEKEVIIQSKVLNQNVRNLMQHQSKINMSQELFIFKCYLSSQFDSIKDNKPLTIKRQSFPQSTKLTMRVIHGYFQEQATKIICANLPTFGAYKTIFNKSIESKEVKEFKQLQAKGEKKSIVQDNLANSKTCFNYFGHAMQFDFFNSLVQPVSLESYIRRFSIIEDTAICQALILGALDSIPINKPELQDSDEQQKWQDEVQKMAKEFCEYFEVYFENEEDSAGVLDIAGRIAALRRQKKEHLSTILKRYWCR